MSTMTPNCDCWSSNDVAIVPDLGIAASFDPGALDRASVDMVNQAAVMAGSELSERGYQEGDKFNFIHDKAPWQVTLQHAEEIGLGTQDYKLKISN